MNDTVSLDLFASAVVPVFPRRRVRSKCLVGHSWTKNKHPCFRHVSYIVLGLALVCLCMPGGQTFAQDEEMSEQKGLRIATKASERNDGFGDFSAKLTMVIRNRQGREKVRELRFKVLEVPEDGNKSLFVFDKPKDVQGTALLIHAHIDEPDDQWIFLPALQRVKRISTSERSGSFMGSEFSYEDLSEPEVEEFTYKYLRDEPCGELTCTVTEHYPVDEKSGYNRKIVWQDTEEFRTWKMELYDRRDVHLKTLTFTDYQEYNEKFWRAGEQTMVNHLTSASTVLRWNDYKFGLNLDESEFSTTALRRIR